MRSFTLALSILLVPSLLCPRLVDTAVAQRKQLATITTVEVGQLPAIVGKSHDITVRSKGQCGQVTIDFGDGSSGGVRNAAVQAIGNTFSYKVQHTYTKAGKLTVTATGTVNCTGKATAAVDVQFMGIGGPTPIAQPGGPVPSLWPFTLASVYYYLPVMGKVESTLNSANETVRMFTPPWPNLKMQDNSISFVFKHSGVPKAAIDWILAHPPARWPGASTTVYDRACCFKFTVTNEDGRSVLDRSWEAALSADHDNNLVVTLWKDFEHTEFLSPLAHLRIDMEVRWQGKTYKAKAAHIVHGGYLINFFENFIYPTFKSERCTTCHAMGDRDAIIAQHNKTNLDIGGLDHMRPELVQPGQTAACAQCHAPPHVSDWRTPPFSQGINWKTMTTWSQVCQTVVQHLQPPNQIVMTADTLPKTQAKMRDHFHNDPRVLWAIGDGETPFHQHLTRAPPADLTVWFNLIDIWINLPKQSLSEFCIDQRFQ